MIKIGQTVRVFGVVSDSWILGRVSRVLDSNFVAITIDDWVGIPKGFEVEVSLNNIEAVAGGYKI